MKKRVLLNVEAPPGPLRALVSRPTGDSQNHVFFASLQSNSPMEGKIFPGDWLLTVNGITVTSRDVCVELFQKTAASTRILGISRAPQNGANATNNIGKKYSQNKAATEPKLATSTKSTATDNAVVKTTASVSSNGKENSQNATSNATASKSKPVARPKLVPATTKPLPEQKILLEMTVSQLKQELEQRGVSVKSKPTKDDLLEKLGVPSRQWKQWRKLTIAKLKPILQSRGLPVSGTKQELLTRLGVPVGFGESKHEMWQREQREAHQKKRKLDSELFGRVLSKMQKPSPQNDPTHEEYELPCCSSPKFPPGRTTEPAGYIRFPDGSLMEVWRCLACGKIPERPNAPPIEEFSDTESDAEEYRGGFAGLFHASNIDNFYW